MPPSSNVQVLAVLGLLLLKIDGASREAEFEGGEGWPKSSSVASGHRYACEPHCAADTTTLPASWQYWRFSNEPPGAPEQVLTHLGNGGGSQAIAVAFTPEIDGFGSHLAWDYVNVVRRLVADTGSTPKVTFEWCRCPPAPLPQCTQSFVAACSHYLLSAVETMPYEISCRMGYHGLQRSGLHRLCAAGGRPHRVPRPCRRQPSGGCSDAR